MAVKKGGGSTKSVNVPAHLSRQERAQLEAYFEVVTNAENWEVNSTEAGEETNRETCNALVDRYYLRRWLANHHGITEEEADRLLDERDSNPMVTAAETAILSQVSVNYAGIAPSTPDSPLQPSSRSSHTPFAAPTNPRRLMPVLPNDIPRLTEPPHLLGDLNASLTLPPITKKNTPRPQPPILPPLSALRLPDPYINYISSFPMLPVESMENSGDGTNRFIPYGTQSFQVPVGPNTMHRSEDATGAPTRKSSIFHLIH
ncbi:hypothetical protein BGZ61DRAFT_447442 [Ilyonectria robusta]|uniref:uncharacterized protein n=1 Tax=Ilyonectria robusta TaxID=1079257 RepID=UPI001E8DD018|nr:uncharacterized protein BGZ61DRAFT_447442 [Ilyonectria robusta]KAH8721786.1 hypothetical protein BGZ61DRAFT_447442 [Ilyonectria robusta]